MTSKASLPAVVAAVVLAVGTGCAHETVPAPQTAQVTPTAAPPSQPAPAPARDVHVSDSLAQACQLDFGNPDEAPKFDFNDASILPQDRSVLDQIAKCVTSGPLHGRALKLVGRADPRGEVEYNMALGESRATTVRSYLLQLGVASAKLTETSRGKLDASGTDEAGWRKDRRVDIQLL